MKLKAYLMTVIVIDINYKPRPDLRPYGQLWQYFYVDGSSLRLIDCSPSTAYAVVDQFSVIETS